MKVIKFLNNTKLFSSKEKEEKQICYYIKNNINLLKKVKFPEADFDQLFQREDYSKIIQKWNDNNIHYNNCCSITEISIEDIIIDTDL